MLVFWDIGAVVDTRISILMVVRVSRGADLSLFFVSFDDTMVPMNNFQTKKMLLGVS